MTDHQAIINLFLTCLSSFRAVDSLSIKEVYALPCTLSTPTEFKFIRLQRELDEVITEIMEQLTTAQMEQVRICALSYESLVENQYIACAHWQFETENKQVFADFCAFYHIEVNKDKCLFRHVNSQEVDQLKTFAHSIEIAELEN